MRQVTVAVADDHPIFLSGFVSLLKAMNGVRVLIEATNGEELIDALRTQAVDIAFIDYRMPKLNGINAARSIRAQGLPVKILILSAYDEEEIITEAFASGANGYLTKGDRPEEIELAIDSLMENGLYVNQRASRTLLANISGQFKSTVPAPVDKPGTALNTTEIMVIRLLAKEYSTREIAEVMQKSERTIDSYRAGILKKTGTKNSTGIIIYALREGIIELDQI